MNPTQQRAEELQQAIIAAHDILTRLQPRYSRTTPPNEITRAYVTLQEVQLWLAAYSYLATADNS